MLIGTSRVYVLGAIYNLGITQALLRTIPTSTRQQHETAAHESRNIQWFRIFPH
jgi:hypothetical protein